MVPRAASGAGGASASASESSARVSATTSVAAKLLMYGISPNAVTSTPATEPMVLTKNTLPEPASPVCSARAAAGTMATSSGFIAEVATSGRNSRIRQAREGAEHQVPVRASGAKR